MGRPHRLACILAALSLNAWPIHAQSSMTPTSAAEKTPGWVFTPSLGFGGAWDDNVLLVNPGDNPPSDYASPISPSVSLDFVGRRTRFSAGYDGSVVMYRTLDALNNFEQVFRSIVEHRSTRRITISAEENLTIAPTTDALLLAGVPFYRIGSHTNAVGGGVKAALARHTLLRANYTLRSVGFEFNERLAQQLQGGHAHEILVSLEQALSPRFTMGGDYSFQRAIVGNEDVVVPAQQDRFNIQSGRATAAYLIAPTVTLSGAFGVARVGPGLLHEGRTGPTWQAGITQKGRYALLSASYRRSYVPSFGFGGTFQNEEWDANAHVPFARNRAYVDGNLARFDNESFELGQRPLQSLWLSGTVGYRATRWLNVEGYYARTHQNTQRAGGELARNQLGFRIVATKPMRLR